MWRNLSLFTFIFFVLFFSAQTRAEIYKLTTITDDLNYPWALAILPEGGYLITEKPGKLLRLSPDGNKSEIKGLPSILARKQGGLLDIILSPTFKTDKTVYFSYVSRIMGGHATHVAKAKLNGDELENVKTIFVARPAKRSDLHFGSRLLFGPDEMLYITLGDRGQMNEAQKRENHLGTIVRINPDGTIPDDNPFLSNADFKHEIFSYGHRNVQGIALEPISNKIWAHEHGPQGGDEVNILKKGANYGWPEVSYGIDYDGSIITQLTKKDGVEDPILHWTPSIAPCGMSFYMGDKFPKWQGNLFVGALAGAHLRRLEIKDDKVIKQETLLEELEERIRDVRTGKDGYIYILTDSHDGKLIRLEPK